jgi:hypothetical protein
LNTPKTPTYGWVYGIVLFLAVAVFGAGVGLAAKGAGFTLLAAGVVSLVGVLVTWPLSCAVGHVDAAVDRAVQPLLDRLQSATTTLNLIAEQQLISDRAKQVAFREKDRDAFHRAIHEDVAKGDYEAAIGLIDDMDAEFGRKIESDRLRDEVIGRREEVFGRQLDEAMKLVDRFIELEQWPAALKEAERIKSLYPSQTRAHTLATDIEDKRIAVKKQLLGRWQEAVRTRHVDEAIVVLKRLDVYLTPVEASGLEEDARMIFKEKLNQLREGFTTAVQRSQWTEAKRLGEIIKNDFPNTQMAREVREMWTTLEGRLKAEPVAVGT